MVIKLVATVLLGSHQIFDRHSNIVKLKLSNVQFGLQDIPTGADSCVTSLACDSVGRSLLIAGCGDGSVRLFDRRLPPSDR